jgi:hypothetical protein
MVLFSLLVFSQPSQAYEMGCFTSSPATALYVVNDGQSHVELKLDLIKATRRSNDRVTVRIFDPQEKLVFWKLIEIGKLSDGEFGLGTVEMQGMGGDLLQPVKPEQLVQKFNYQMEQKGIYQIRVVAGSSNTMIQVSLSRPLPWGVSFQNGDWFPWENQPAKLYAYVPPHARHLSIKGFGIAVNNENGHRVIDTLDSGRKEKTVRADIPKTDMVYTVEFAPDKKWKMRAWDMPLILCDSPQAAQAIKASIIQTPDGIVVAHQFQTQILQLRKKLLDPQFVGKTDELLAETRMTDKHRQAMLADAQRCSLLFNGSTNLFHRMDYFLTSQNLDPNSHWAGSVRGWQAYENKQGLDGRWDLYEQIPGISAGISENYQTFLADAVWLVNLDEPFNPYFGKKQIIHRAILGALVDLLRINEAERYPALDADPYPGGTASFDLGRKFFPIYREAIAHASSDVAFVWTEALQRMVDRSYPDGLVSARNQSAHYLLAMDDFAQGSGLQRYAKMARRYAQRFVAGANKAGYQKEACGPDATYNGMTRWHEAAYYIQSKDPTILESLRSSSDFFMHTVAPEPDGMCVRGGFNFGQRTASGFYHSQWGDARSILYDIMPDLALWKAYKSPQTLTSAQSSIRQSWQRPTNEQYRWLGVQISRMAFERFGLEPATGGQWPALEEKDFIRNFGDELIAVKRPGYFTSIYVGKPAGEFYIRSRTKLRPAYPNNAESHGGKIKGLNHRPQTPLIGGGMTILSSPDYGSALLATNCSPLTYHGPVVIDQNDQRYWAQYHATNFKLDEAQSTLTIDGKVEDQPVIYQRQYQFQPDQIIVKVTYTATDDVNEKSFIENIPVALGNFKANGAMLTVDGNQVDQAMASTIQLRDNNGHGFDIAFTSTQDLHIVRNGLIEDWAGKKVQFGRVEVKLPASMTKGQAVTVQYAFKPIKPK